MALTSKEQLLLLGARTRLLDKRVDYVCHGIEQACQANGWDPSCKARTRLKKYIYGQLKTKTHGHVEQHYTLEDWQESSGLGLRAPDVVRKDRIAWVDWMLGEQ